MHKMNINAWKKTQTQNVENHDIIKNNIQDCANLEFRPTNIVLTISVKSLIKTSISIQI